MKEHRNVKMIFRTLSAITLSTWEAPIDYMPPAGATVKFNDTIYTVNGVQPYFDLDIEKLTLIVICSPGFIDPTIQEIVESIL